MAQAGKWVVKTPIEIGVCRARPFALLFANQCSPIRSQADVLVDTLHCKTEQRRASVLCQLGVQLAARRPIDIVGVGPNLFDPPIYLSKPSAVATSPFSDYFANKAAILVNNAHAVMIHQKLRYQNIKIALFGNRK